MMTYRDLDNDLMKYSAFQTLVSGPTSAQRGQLQGTSMEVPPELYMLLPHPKAA